MCSGTRSCTFEKSEVSPVCGTKIIVVSLIQAEITNFEVLAKSQDFASILAHFTVNSMKTMKISALILTFLNNSKINCRMVICISFYENILSKVSNKRTQHKFDSF